MAKVRLTGRGMATFSSYMGKTLFKDGISVDDVSPAEIRLLGAITSIEVIDEDGATRQGGHNADHAAARTRMQAPKAEYHPRGEDAPARAEITPAPELHEPPKRKALDEDEAEDALEAALNNGDGDDDFVGGTAEEALTPIYTETDLAEIAERKGIKGLREIAEPMGVRARSIGEMIAAILHRQKNPKVEH